MLIAPLSGLIQIKARSAQGAISYGGDIMYIYGHKESDRGSGRSSGGEDLTIE
jgi:hypothetical protein